MKKILSIVLCLAMLLTLLPMAVFAENPFTDVKESDYFFDPVLWAVENGITNGMSATTFEPNTNCTRGQVVTFLYRAAGSPEPMMTENPFTDVSKSDYFYKAVLWAVENGITNGMSATTFEPNTSCTRGQVVTFLWRADGATAPNSDENPFTDIAFGAYFYNAVLWAVEKGITNGVSATEFGPEATCTRGQIVTFLYRYMMAKEAELSIVFQPDDYLMQSSQELAEFTIVVKGGSAPYTFQWVICYDDEEVFTDPLTADSAVHTFSHEFSDYDFDEYSNISVYCLVTDNEGSMVCSKSARVWAYFTIITQPEHYQMVSSMEKAYFTVEIDGTYGPFTYEWFVCFENDEIALEPVTTWESSNTMTYTFSDYDFDTYSDIGAYCVITDRMGHSIQSELACVYQNFYILSQPQDYQMLSSMEDADFTIRVSGGAAPYSYQWVVCYDNKEVYLDPISSDSTSNSLIYEFTDYDFDDYNNIGVFCIVTDSLGSVRTSGLANVYPKH